MDAVLRRRAQVDADAAYRWFTSFEDADLRIQRALQEQRVQRKGERDLVVDRVLDFGQGAFDVHIEVRLRPPRAYDARVHAKEGAFDMAFVFEPRGAECDVVVTIRGEPGTPTHDAAFRAQVERSVSQNLDDYVPAMERELGRR